MEKLGGFIFAGLSLYLAYGFLVQPVSIEEMPSGFSDKTALVYFGAHDCGACLSFKADGMKQVTKSASNHRYRFVKRDISSLHNLGKQGAFGSYDSMFRAAVKKSGQLAVPTFAVVKDGKVQSAIAGNWPYAITKAKAAVAKN